MRRAALVSLWLCGCAGGSQVDVELLSSPEAMVRLLTVEARSGGSTLGSVSFPPDGGAGVALPSTLRLLVAAPSLEVEATAFDFDGRTRHRVERLASLRGFEQLSIDLSDRSWCPAPPPEPDEQVFYGEALADRVFIFGYSGTPPPPTAQACTGAEAREYPATHQYDGMGFSYPDARPRRLSLRAWASQTSLWHVGVFREDGTADYWLQPQGLCTEQAGCGLALDTEWRRLSYEIPSGLRPTNKLLIQTSTPINNGAVVQLRIDDVRLQFY